MEIVGVKITKITTQKQNKERYNIFVDYGQGEEYGFSVDQDILVAYKLKKGLELQNDMLSEMLFEDNIKKAFSLALSFLSYRMRAEKEVVKYLQEKNVEESIIPKVIEKLFHYKYLNDLEFAKAFVRTRMNTTLKGPDFIKKELQDKGINAQYIEKALEQYTGELQLQHVLLFIEKKAKQNQTNSNTMLKRKITANLLGKGFSIDIIEKALKILTVENSKEEQMEVLKNQAKKISNKLMNLTQYERELKLKQYLYRKGFPIELIDEYIKDLRARFY